MQLQSHLPILRSLFQLLDEIEVLPLVECDATVFNNETQGVVDKEEQYLQQLTDRQKQISSVVDGVIKPPKNAVSKFLSKLATKVIDCILAQFLYHDSYTEYECG